MNLAEELSIQLYTLRAHGDLETQLKALADQGFRRVEIVGRHLADAEGNRALLDAAGIAAPTGHVGMADLRLCPDWVLTQARIIGIEQLFMPAVAPDERSGQPVDYWRLIGEELAGLAERFAEAGVALGYHNHDWEVRPYPDGSTPLGHLFAAAAGSPLTWQADLAWLVRGGADPAYWLERLRDRLVAVHVKDIAAPGRNLDEDGWADVGQGVLDWPGLWRVSRENGARWMVLEHDKPKDPLGFASRSRAFLLKQFA